MFREKILFENIIVDDVLEKTFTKKRLLAFVVSDDPMKSIDGKFHEN